MLFRALAAALILALATGAGLAVAAPQAQPAASAPAPASSEPSDTKAGAPPLRIIIEVPNDAQGRAYLTDTVIPRLSPGTGGTLGSAPAQPGAGTAGEGAGPAAGAAPAPAGSGVATHPDTTTGEMPMMAAEQLQQVRRRAEQLVRTAPFVPEAVVAGWRTVSAMEHSVDLVWLVGAVLLFTAGGLAARRAAWWSARGLLARILESPGDTVRQRLHTQMLRLSMAVYVLTASILGSLGAFLLFPWPPIFRELALVGLIAVVMPGFAMTLGRIALAPGARHLHFRLLPVSTPLAWFWFYRMLTVVWIFAAGWAVLSILRIVGVPYPAREVIAAVWLAILGGAMVAIAWQRHVFPGEEPTSRIATALFTAAVALLWLMAALRLDALFWTLAIAVAGPLLVNVAGRIIGNVVGREDAEARGDTRLLAWAVVAERAFNTLVVITSASILARAWGFDIGEIAMGETVVTRAMRSGVRIVIVLLVADLIWRLTRALIDGSLSGPLAEHADDTPEGRKRQRLRTLLPILRNLLMVLIVSITVLMVLDALGIQIGPLLAGAGVIGIAVGFGAQTLVKDIISGVFYLLDDAFRVGEYIQTRTHKGTVESFSLRSVKLRHHRGPLTTVPFGELGAVQNLSRDWVIDKMTIGVTYDTDLDLAKRIVKEVGRELAADPDFAPHILEPLKMQGVEQLGDYAIQLRIKIMTKPGEQFVIRRRAYALIKKAFDANGIKFAFPMVTVAGGTPGEDMAAAAQRGFALTHPKPQENAAE